MDNRDMPAMPTEHNTEHFQHSNVYTTGLTKREYFAVRMMAAYRADPENNSIDSEQVSRWALDDADALLKQLEESE